MNLCDWSSDVCSSDLPVPAACGAGAGGIFAELDRECGCGLVGFPPGRDRQRCINSDLLCPYLPPKGQTDVCRPYIIITAAEISSAAVCHRNELDFSKANEPGVILSERKRVEESTQHRLWVENNGWEDPSTTHLRCSTQDDTQLGNFSSVVAIS